MKIATCGCLGVTFPALCVGLGNLHHQTDRKRLEDCGYLQPIDYTSGFSVSGNLSWSGYDKGMAQEEIVLTREKLADALNEDLSREYQAIIAYVNYSQVLKGAAYMNIADELAVHAKEELDHALQISNHVDYLGGMPSVTPKPVKTSDKAEDMLKFDLENEKETIRQYRRRVKQADALNEFAIAESLRSILVEEQDHLISLATALGIDPPDCGIAD